MNSSNSFSLKLFGSPGLEGANGVSVVGPAAQRHRLGLLALLALAPGNVSSRDRLMTLLWPESDAERARSLLNQAVYQLRKVLGEDAIISVGDELRLETDRVDVDAVRFETLLAKGDAAAGAALYRGPLMDGFFLSGADAFEEWLEREQARLSRAYADALESLAEAAAAAGDHHVAVRWWQARAAHDPYDSRVAHRLIQALDAAGNPAGALRHASDHIELLREEFDIAPPVELTELQARLRSQGTDRTGAGTPGARHDVDLRGSDEAAPEAAPGFGPDRRDGGREQAPPRPGGRPRQGALPATALGAAVVGAASFWLLSGEVDRRWLDREALPAIEQALDVADWESAFALAVRIEERVPESSVLGELWPRLSWVTTLESEPPGARVFRTGYGDDDGWTELGRTPLVDIRIPYGLSQLRFELEGHRPLVRVVGGAHLNWTELGSGNNPDGLLVGPQRFRLDTEESMPEDMVRVPGWSQAFGRDTVQLQDFFLSRYEVTNSEFRDFVEAGGYERPALWAAPIVVGGDTLAWAEAMERFVDRTGRPGPSTWEAGDYRSGEDDYPVSGVSWYEADAYARFRALELPTAPHWQRALANAMFPWLLPASNFGQVGPRAVAQGHAMSFVGAYDLAGNVREWTSTSLGDARVVLGGSWNDPYYIAGTEDASAPADDRSPGNGIRLALTMDEPDAADVVRAPMTRVTAPPRVAAEPVSDSVYAAYSRLFDYDRLPLNEAVEAVDTTRLWTRQRVSFDAAYGPERVVLHLYLPRDATPPYQTVVYWPGWDVFRLDDVDEYFSKQLDFVIKSGRAVAFPIYRGTFERRVEGRNQRAEFGTAEYRDNAVHGVKDLRRTLDYLETRGDIDRDSFAFFGYSWGGVNGPLALAQDERFRVAVIYIGLLPDLSATPEVDPVNALTRVSAPTLLLSGEFDSMVPSDNAQRYFDLIGVPAEQKRHEVAIGGHFVPRPLLIRETWEWLNRWLGAPSA